MSDALLALSHSRRRRVLPSVQGKGSTSAFCESILRHTGCRTGLFTSPHLVNINERIRLDGAPISDEKFCLYFWQVWNKLEETCTPERGMPAYFRFLTLLGYYVFIKEGVDVAVVEVGLGGRIDSTNVVNRPIVCGIASLGFDHVELLGDTLAKIAREKAGIFKQGVPAFTMDQDPEAMASLRACADERGVEFLERSQKITDYALPPGRDAIELGIPGVHQETNAGLAVSLCSTFQARAGKAFGRIVTDDGSALTSDCVKGLELCKWPGRGQIERDSAANGGEENILFYLDGAHTKESMDCCARWYHSATKLALEARKGEKWLLFNCMQERDPNILFEPLAAPNHATASGFTRALFVPFVSSTKNLDQNNESDFKWESSLKKIWDRMVARSRDQDVSAGGERGGSSESSALSSLGETPSSTVCTAGSALTTLRTYARQNSTKQIHVLVTGSLYLVGDFLRILQKVP